MHISVGQVPLNAPGSGSAMRLELSSDGQEIVLFIPIAFLAEDMWARLVFGAENFHSFTSREKEVFAYLRAGKVNKEIASAANISVRTVKYHLSNVYRKLHVRGRLEAVRLCERK
jgi:DNA-binding NarL/FixJ family response regulator